MTTTSPATTSPARHTAEPSRRPDRGPRSIAPHGRLDRRLERRNERGQGTVEYALILLGAAAVALVVVAWVTRTDLIGRLFDTVVGSILRQVT